MCFFIYAYCIHIIYIFYSIFFLLANTISFSCPVNIVLYSIFFPCDSLRQSFERIEKQIKVPVYVFLKKFILYLLPEIENTPKIFGNLINWITKIVYNILKYATFFHVMFSCYNFNGVFFQLLMAKVLSFSH